MRGRGGVQRAPARHLHQRPPVQRSTHACPTPGTVLHPGVIRLCVVPRDLLGPLATGVVGRGNLPWAGGPGGTQ